MLSENLERMASGIKFSIDDENYLRILQSDKALEGAYMNGYHDGLKMARLAVLKLKQAKADEQILRDRQETQQQG